MAKQNKLSVEVISPTELVYRGSAVAVTSNNEKGNFDVLPYHANFICIIKDFLIVHFDKDKKKKQQFEVNRGGVLHCKEDVVRVFLNVASWEE